MILQQGNSSACAVEEELGSSCLLKCVILLTMWFQKTTTQYKEKSVMFNTGCGSISISSLRLARLWGHVERAVGPREKWWLPWLHCTSAAVDTQSLWLFVYVYIPVHTYVHTCSWIAALTTADFWPQLAENEYQLRLVKSHWVCVCVIFWVV